PVPFNTTNTAAPQRTPEAQPKPLRCVLTTLVASMRIMPLSLLATKDGNRYQSIASGGASDRDLSSEPKSEAKSQRVALLVASAAHTLHEISNPNRSSPLTEHPPAVIFSDIFECFLVTFLKNLPA